MDFPQLTGPASVAQDDANTKDAAADAGDFNAFLSLLTAQVRHQDPLAPLDSTQFVEQLATFSALEQQVRTNEHLEAIGALIASGGLTEGEGS